MEKEHDPDNAVVENTDPVLDSLAEGVKQLYLFRDLFFENYPIEKASEKNSLVEEQMKTLMEKFEEIDENQLQPSQRAQYLYLKGRAYNVGPTYEPRATHSLSKAVKLNPRHVEAWNELGESYWKNKNIKDAKSSFEGALKHERNRIALRCLSIILRQETTNSASENIQAIQKSVDLAKEAVAQDAKDGVSWSVLGNSHLCRYFLVSQQPATLRACLGAYRQARADPAARHQPDLHYNTAVAYKYNEQYKEALQSFHQACLLEPPWTVPREERDQLLEYLRKVHELVKTRGKARGKKLAQMAQSIDKKMLGPYSEGLELTPLTELVDGENPGRVVLGKVVGSVLSDNLVPFTFALMDSAQTCVSVTVYNWSQRGVIIGDCVAIPSPATMTHADSELNYNFRNIRVNNPMSLLVNGKKVGRDQFAGTRVTSTYEIH